MNAGNRDLLDELNAVIVLRIIAILIGAPLLAFSIALRLHAGSYSEAAAIGGYAVGLIAVGIILHAARSKGVS